MAQLFSENHLPSPKHSCVYSAQDSTATECQDEGVLTDLDFQNGKRHINCDTRVLIGSEE